MPNVFYYHTNEDFDIDTFFIEPTICFGNKSNIIDKYGHKGGRSVMFPAIRLMYYLGIRTIYLLGCDFNMLEKEPYAFEQDKWKGGCKTNNDCYKIMNDRFTKLRPVAENQHGLKIYNCTPNSKLTAFDYMDYQEAISITLKGFPQQSDINLSKMYGSK